MIGKELIPPEKGEFKGKTIIVTGGSSGIGLSTAKFFSTESGKVAVFDISDKPDFLHESNFRRVDVTHWEKVKSSVASVVKHFGKLDIVINNAGVKIKGNILDVSSEDFEKLLKINGLGFWNVAKACMPYLIKSHGTLINVCSGTSESLPPNADAYFGSKGVTYSLTHSLASSFREKGVRILGIGPGPVDTPLWRKGKSKYSIKKSLSGNLGPRVLHPDDIASMILSLASKNNKSFDGKIYRYL